MEMDSLSPSLLGAPAVPSVTERAVQTKLRGPHAASLHSSEPRSRGWGGTWTPSTVNLDF